MLGGPNLKCIRLVWDRRRNCLESHATAFLSSTSMSRIYTTKLNLMVPEEWIIFLVCEYLYGNESRNDRLHSSDGARTGGGAWGVACTVSTGTSAPPSDNAVAGGSSSPSVSRSVTGIYI